MKKLEELEKVKFEFDKGSFGEFDSIHCSKCNKKIKKTYIDFKIPNSFIKIKLGVFRCSKCKEEQLDFSNAKLLDRALEINRLLNDESYTMKRNLSFDGDNFILRVPNDFTKGFGKKAFAELKPISNDSFLVEIRK